MARIDGGPAFPTAEYYDEKCIGCEPGMSLRDYFAAKAMHAELVTAGALPEPAEALAAAANAAGMRIEERIAFNAYVLADAMLKARESR